MIKEIQSVLKLIGGSSDLTKLWLVIVYCLYLPETAIQYGGINGDWIAEVLAVVLLYCVFLAQVYLCMVVSRKYKICYYNIAIFLSTFPILGALVYLACALYFGNAIQTDGRAA